MWAKKLRTSKKMKEEGEPSSHHSINPVKLILQKNNRRLNGMDRITENGIDFNDFEQWCFDMGMTFAKSLMETGLNELDTKILKSRDCTEYRAKDLRPLTIKTLMGEVEIKRRLYRKPCGEYVYLLDEAINLDTIGKMSSNLVHRITETVTECSYRATSEIVSSMTGQSISHGGAWNIVQNIGEKIREKDEAHAKLAKIFPDRGKKEVKALHEEFDGVWVNMQGKDRPKKGRKSEMKLAVCYEGMEYKGTDKKGKASYDMVNPLYMVGFENVKEFCEKKEGQIGALYNLDEIEVRLTNADGGGWAQSACESSGGNFHMQISNFHVKSSITSSGIAKEHKTKINSLLKCKKIDEMLEYIKLLMERETDDDRKEKIKETWQYLFNNKESLIPIKERNLELPDLPDGIYYGNMGVIESTVCNVVALRMKKRKASFTKNGAVNLARLICFKRSGNLDETIYNLSEMQLPMILEEVITTILSAAKAPKKDGKGFFYPVNGGVPFVGAYTTNGRKAVKGITDYRTFSDLSLRF
jgi:hypothetical protein